MKKVYAPFFSEENTVTDNTYLNVLQIWLFPPHPLHRKLEVRRYLNDELLQRWIRRIGAIDLAIQPWPPRSQDLTACDFFLWDYSKDEVYVPTIT